MKKRTRKEDLITLLSHSSALRIESKFRLQVNDRWVLPLDPDEIRERSIRTHDNDEWYRTAALYCLQGMYNGQDIVTIMMLFTDGDRTEQLFETYVRENDKTQDRPSDPRPVDA